MWMNNMLEYIYRNYSIQRPPSDKRPSSNECPPNSFIFHKHIYSISMIALLEYMRTTAVYLRLNALLQLHHKSNGLLISLLTIMSMWEHSSFKRVISSKNFEILRWLLDRPSQEGSKDNKSTFQSSCSFTNKHQILVYYFLLCFKKRE